MLRFEGGILRGTMVSEVAVIGASGREMVRVASLDELVPGSFKLVRAGSARIALGMIGAAAFAVGARCTHAKVYLAPGKLGEDGLIECPVHGAKFSPVDGSVKCLPATDPLPVYDVRVIGDDVFVDPGPEPAEAPADVTKPGARPSAAQWGKWQ